CERAQQRGGRLRRMGHAGDDGRSEPEFRDDEPAPKRCAGTDTADTVRPERLASAGAGGELRDGSADPYGSEQDPQKPGEGHRPPTIQTGSDPAPLLENSFATGAEIDDAAAFELELLRLVARELR